MKRQSVSKEEALAIIEAANTSIKRLFIETLWYTGSRQGEARLLKPENIGKDFIVLVNLKQHKPMQDHKEVFVPRRFIDRLRGFVVDNHIPSANYIFSRDGIKPWSKERAWQIVTQAAEKAGVMKVNAYGRIVPAWPHSFRHGNAEYLYEQTNDIIFVQEQLGHANLSNTQIYTKISEKRKREYIEKI